MKTTQSKAAFIRSLPGDMPAAEVVKRGAKHGHKFTTSYVHGQRSRESQRVQSTLAGATPPEPVTELPAVGLNLSVEEIDSAIRTLQQVRKLVTLILGGDA